VPSYDYRCHACKRRVVLTYKTYKDYDVAIPTCPHCQSRDLTRVIGRVAIAKSDASRYDALSDDPAMDDMADADPATLGRYLRKIGDETGENLGDEFHEVVNRLERGESPEDIEATMPHLGGMDDSGAMGAGMDSGAFGGSDD
jgi:putative FmdB family regulatory protein